MIPINIVSVRVPGQAPDALLESEAYICPARIDTVTPVTNHAQHQVPTQCNAVIRYNDPVNGFRLFYVTETAKQVARMRFRSVQGEDPSSPDFNGDAVPDGI